MADYANTAFITNYFNYRLHSAAWWSASDDERRQAISMANQALERLSYVGQKLVDSQADEWPRKQDPFIYDSRFDTNATPPPLYNGQVPDDIKIAVCEIAFALIDGVDMEREIEKLNVLTTEYARIKTDYTRQFTMQHIRNLIPSATAWAHLVPYLRDNAGSRMIRVS